MDEELDTNAEEVEDAEHVFDVDSGKEVLQASYDITSYGADYPVDGLVKRLQQGDIVVPTFDPEYDESETIRGFQRQFVWTRPQMDRFLESLLLGLPVPGVFLVREPTNVLLVLDGQQRLRTLAAFYRGLYAGREYALRHIVDQFEGRTYTTLDPEDRRRLDDSIIHATVLSQDPSVTSQAAVYSIFERLNTGGSQLQPQEIRVALYSGPFLRVISELNGDTNWRQLYGPRSARFKDQELILRVFALFEQSAEYRRPVKGFLNDYLEMNRDRSGSATASLTNGFRAATALAVTSIGLQAFKPVRALNAAVVDSLTVGLMRRLSSGAEVVAEQVGPAYRALLSDPMYQAATTSSTAAPESVEQRLRLATAAFEAV
ncbi:MAG: GmrSD restriction endonuclease domain-containing protein [Candidatus Dormibacteria bacterium]